MKKRKFHFKFNKQEQSGIFFLLLIIIVLQLGYFLYTTLESNQWGNFFKLDADTQVQIDSLKQKRIEKNAITKQYPFNPNFITDYKGYTMGMSVEEIDRLHAFRLQDKYVNSSKEFQEVTQVSDSLLSVIAPYFKFPELTQKKRNINTIVVTKVAVEKNNHFKDLNTVTALELTGVYGIGDKLSKRIKFRERLGGFLFAEQLQDVYGLKQEVVKKVLLKYKVLTNPVVYRVNINTASAFEIAKRGYVNYSLAKKIIAYRGNIGIIKSFEELKEIEGFPSDKIDRIKLYLKLK